MRVRFLKDVTLQGVRNAGCFGGPSGRFEESFKAWQVAEFADIWKGEKVKAHGGAYCLCDLILKNSNSGTMHPDRFEDVPSNVFEVLPDGVPTTGISIADTVQFVYDNYNELFQKLSD